MRLFVVLVIAVFLIAGCSSSGEGQPQSEKTFYVGVISLRVEPDSIPFQTNVSTEVGTFAEFHQLSNVVTAQELKAIYTLPADTCSVFSRDSDTSFSPVSSIRTYGSIQQSGATALSVDIGESILFSTSQGTWAESQRYAIDESYFYRNFTELAGLLTPGEMTVDISGNTVFPALSVPLERVDPPVLSSPAAGAITTFGNAFQWSVTDSVNTFIRITAFKVVGSKNVFVDCYAMDDGEFVIPASLPDMLEPDQFNDYSFAISRGAATTIETDNTLLLILRYQGQGG